MITIKRIVPGGDLREFLNVVERIYEGDPNFIRELDFDVKGRLSPKHPFFEHGEAQIFTAHRDGLCVGRCTAQIDRLHLSQHEDDTGFFGFLDTIEDVEVVRALLQAAEEWLKGKGMKHIRGPFMLTSNDQVGCLVEGFDREPMFMMPYHRPYQGRLIEEAGIPKRVDAFAWYYDIGKALPKRAEKAHAAVAALPEVKTRHMDLKNIERDVRIVMDVFNRAWHEHWWAIPLTEAELKKFADEFKMIAVPEITLITEIDGEPVAIAFAIPNLNEGIRHVNGKLFPTGIFKLLWHTKIHRPKSARLIILGVVPEIRNQKKYGGLSTYLYAEINRCAQLAGFEWGELSFTMEDNRPVNLGIKAMGGEIYKRYRIYERPIS